MERSTCFRQITFFNTPVTYRTITLSPFQTITLRFQCLLASGWIRAIVLDIWFRLTRDFHRNKFPPQLAKRTLFNVWKSWKPAP